MKRESFTWPALLAPLGLLLCLLLGHPKLQPLVLPVGEALKLYCRRCLRWRGYYLWTVGMSSFTEIEGPGWSLRVTTEM